MHRRLVRCILPLIVHYKLVLRSHSKGLQCQCSEATVTPVPVQMRYPSPCSSAQERLRVTGAWQSPGNGLKKVSDAQHSIRTQCGTRQYHLPVDLRGQAEILPHLVDAGRQQLDDGEVLAGLLHGMPHAPIVKRPLHLHVLAPMAPCAHTGPAISAATPSLCYAA